MLLECLNIMISPIYQHKILDYGQARAKFVNCCRIFFEKRVFLRSGIYGLGLINLKLSEGIFTGFIAKC